MMPTKFVLCTIAMRPNAGTQTLDLGNEGFASHNIEISIHSVSQVLASPPNEHNLSGPGRATWRSLLRCPSSHTAPHRRAVWVRWSAWLGGMGFMVRPRKPPIERKEDQQEAKDHKRQTNFLESGLTNAID